MDDLFKNKLFVVVLFLGAALFAAYTFSGKLTDKIADRVIEKMMRDYSPSPYGPGFDPDKVDVERMRRENSVPEWQR